MILAEMSHTALYLMTEAAFNSGLNPHVYVTYRHMASEHLLFGVLNASVGLISLAGVEASFAGVDCTPSIFMIETCLFSTLSVSFIAVEGRQPGGKRTGESQLAKGLSLLIDLDDNLIGETAGLSVCSLEETLTRIDSRIGTTKGSLEILNTFSLPQSALHPCLQVAEKNAF